MSLLSDASRVFRGRKARLETVSVLGRSTADGGFDPTPPPAEPPVPDPSPTPPPADPVPVAPPPAPAPSVPLRRRG
jgi:hypothetical protein